MADRKQALSRNPEAEEPKLSLLDYMDARLAQISPPIDPYQPRQPEVEQMRPSRSMLETIGDTSIEFGSQVVGGVKAVSDMVSPGNRFSRGLERQLRDSEAKQSDATKADKSQLAQRLQNADGFFDEAGIYGKEALTSPLRTAAMIGGNLYGAGAATRTGRGIAEIGAAGNALLRGGSLNAAEAAAAKVATTGALAGGATYGGLAGGGDAAGQAYDLVKQMDRSLVLESNDGKQLLAQGLSPDDVVEAMAISAARKASVLPAIMGAGMGMVGAERVLAGRLPNATTRRGAALRTGAVEGATEGLEEAVTGISGRYFPSQIDPSIDPMKGAGAEFAGGAIMGGGLGAATGAIAGPDRTINPVDPAAAQTDPAAQTTSVPQGGVAQGVSQPAATDDLDGRLSGMGAVDADGNPIDAPQQGAVSPQGATQQPGIEPADPQQDTGTPFAATATVPDPETYDDVKMLTPKAQQQLLDKAMSDFARSVQLEDGPIDEPVMAKVAVDGEVDGKRLNSARRMARTIKKLFDVDVVVADFGADGRVKTQSGRDLGLAPNGFRTNADGTIVIDVRSADLLKTPIHEIVHDLEVKFPDLYKPLEEIAFKYADPVKARALDEFLKLEGEGNSARRSELVAEVIAERSNQQLWDDLFQRAGESAPGLRDQILRWLDKLYTEIKGNLGFVKDAARINEIRSEMNTAFTQWQARTAEGRAAATPAAPTAPATAPVTAQQTPTDAATSRTDQETVEQPEPQMPAEPEARYQFIRDAVISGRTRPSTTGIQTAHKIGYSQAVKFANRLEKDGVITPPNERGLRTVNANALRAPAANTEERPSNTKQTPAGKSQQPATAQPEITEPDDIPESALVDEEYNEEPPIKYSRVRAAVTDEVEISTQNPTAVKRRYDPITEMLSIDEAAVKEAMDDNPEIRERTIDAILGYGFIPEDTPRDKAIEVFKKNVISNLLYLHGKVPAEIAARSKLWYDGANKIAKEFAEEFGLSLQQVSAIMAAMSPQKDWFQNVSMAERAIVILTNQGEAKWTADMLRYARSYIYESKDAKEREKRQDAYDRAVKIMEDEVSLKNMEDKDAAVFIRSFDEAFHSRQYRVVTPEGGFAQLVTNNDGTPATMMWSTYGPIQKTVSIFRDGSRKNISDQLGDEHKIRSFYNNIAAPNSPIGHVTIDTHAVAAALFEALSGTDAPVTQNFGGTGKSAILGVGGTYGIIADAYRDAAEQVKVKPREMQSITWEAVRGLFGEDTKSTVKPKVRAIWDQYRSGDLSFEQAREQIVDVAGDIDDPDWVGSDEGQFVKDGGTSYDRDFVPDGGVRLRQENELRYKQTVNLTAATSTIPGIQELYGRAMEGDAEAANLIRRVSESSLRFLLSGTSARIEVEDSVGAYASEREPSVSLKVAFNDSEAPAVLAALSRFASMYNQEQIHVRSATSRPVGHTFDDGSYATSVYEIPISEPLTAQEISEIIAESGLGGLTVTGSAITAYWVRPNERSEESQDLQTFRERVARVHRRVAGDSGPLRRRVERLYAYGRGDGASIGFERIDGDVRTREAADTKTPRLVAEYLRKAEVKPFQQKALTKGQVKDQQTLAAVFEALPDNDLNSPLVKLAYEAAAEELIEQYKSLPIKVEVSATVKIGEEVFPYWGKGSKDLVDRLVKNGLPQARAQTVVDYLQRNYGKPSKAWKGTPAAAIEAMDVDIYPDSNAMRQDVSLNNRLKVYKTTPSTFGPKGSDFSGHPLLKDSGLKDANGYPMLYNDLLRAVHDYFAHNLSATQFGANGEAAAWRNHMASTTDPLARWAITAETRLQNAWQNFRPGVEGIPLKDRPFSIQKASLPPVAFALSGNDLVDAPMLAFIETLSEAERMGSLPPDTKIKLPKIPEPRGGASVQRSRRLDATEAFDPKLIEGATNVEYKGRSKLVSMPILDFLVLAKKDAPRRDSVENVEKLRSEGKQFNTLPFLMFSTTDGDPSAREVTGHEGRHRARQLLMEGYRTMPVTLRGDIRWSEQQDSERFDYKQNWPNRLISEDGDTNRPFPVAREQSTQPYSPVEEDAAVQFSRSIWDNENFKRWFGDSTIVNPDGTPKVMYHGTARDIEQFRAKQAGAIFVTADPAFADDFAGLSENYVKNENVEDMPAAQRRSLAKTVEKKINDNYRRNAGGRDLMLADLQMWVDGAKPQGELRDYVVWAGRKAGVIGGGNNIMPLYVRAERPFDYENEAHLDELGEVYLRVAGKQLRRGAVGSGSWSTIERPEVQQAIKEAGFDAFYIEEGGRKNLAVYDPNQLKSATGNDGQFRLDDPRIQKSRSVAEFVGKVWQNRTTPPFVIVAEEASAPLLMAGMPPGPILLRDSEARHIKNRHADELTPEIIGAMPGLLAEPRAVIVDRKNDSINVFARASNLRGDTVQIALKRSEVEIPKTGKRYPINAAWTVFGRAQSLRFMVAALRGGDVAYMPKQEIERLQQILMGEDPPGPRAQVVNVPSDPALSKYKVGNQSWRAEKTPITIPADWEERVGRGVQFSRPMKRGQKFNIEDASVGTRLSNLFMNEMSRAKDVQEQVVRQGGVLTEDTNLDTRNRLAIRMSGTMLEKFRQTKVDPLTKRASKLDIDLDDVSILMYARHAVERNAYIASINPRFADGGSGMKNAEAQQVFQTLQKTHGRAKYQQMLALADDFQALTKETQNLLVTKGLVDPDVVAAWNATYKNYVPLKGFEKLDETNVVTSNTDPRFNFAKRALGRESRAGQIIENILKDHERAIIMAGENDVRRALLDFVTDPRNKDDDLWEAKRVVLTPQFRKSLPASPLGNAQGIVNYAAKQNTDSKGTVAVRVGGKLVYVTIKDKRLLEDLNANLSSGYPEDAKKFFGAFAQINKTLGFLWTALSPVFTFTNFLRDLSHGTLRTARFYGVAAGARVLGRSFAAVPGIWRAIHNNNWSGGATKYERYFNEYRAEGGAMGRLTQMTVDQQHENLMRAYRKYQGAVGSDPLTWHRPVTNMFSELVDFIVRWNTGLEQAVRVAAYVEAREVRNESPKRASDIAANITTDFSRRGKIAGPLSALYLFYNPAVQGAANVFEMMRGKRGAVLAGSLISLGYMIASMGVVAEGEDEEPFWDNPDNEQTKVKNLVFFGADGTRYTFPLPYGVGWFVNLGYALKDIERGKNAWKTANFVMKSFTQHFSPLGSTDNMATFIAPTALDPAIVLGMGKREDGRPLMPQDFTGNTPDSERYFTNTRGTLVQRATEFVNEATGGNSSREGKISISPEEANYLISYVGGGAGSFVKGVIESITLSADLGPASVIEKNKLPILRSFYRTADNRPYQSAYYENQKEVEIAAKELKEQIRSEDPVTQERLAKNAGIASLSRLSDRYNRQLSLLRKREVEIIQSDKTPQEKEAERKAIDEQRRQLFVTFNSAFYDRRQD